MRWSGGFPSVVWETVAWTRVVFIKTAAKGAVGADPQPPANWRTTPDSHCLVSV